ncbi:MAG: putative phage abortive infection protein [Pseudomonadota bacterium]
MSIFKSSEQQGAARRRKMSEFPLFSYRAIIFVSLLIFAAIIFFWFYWATHTDRIFQTWIGEVSTPEENAPADGKPAAAIDPPASALQRLSQWGGSFGAFSALFGALGFTAIIATLLFQGTALRIQQRELHMDRFDALFFRLIDLLHGVRDGLRYRFSVDFMESPIQLDRGAKTDLMVTGKIAILFVVREMRAWIKSGGGTKDKALPKDEVTKIFDDRVYSRFESDFGPYFRLVETILDKIDGDPVLSESEKHSYAALFRSQIESHALFVIGLRCFMQDAESLKALMEKYEMFGDLYGELRPRILSAAFPGLAADTAPA